MDVLGHLTEWLEPVIQALHIVVVHATNQIKYTALTIIRKIFYRLIFDWNCIRKNVSLIYLSNDITLRMYHNIFGVS